MEKKKVKNAFDEIAGSWHNFRKKPHSEAYSFYLHTEPGKYFLDIGCGSGRHTHLFSKKFHSTGIDTSVEMLKLAKRNGLDVVCADTCHLPFKSNSFNALLSFAVIHHLGKEDQIKAMEESKRVLKKSGKMLISVWRKWQKKFFAKAIYKYFTSHRNEFDVSWGQTLRPYYLFSKKDFKDTLKKAGIHNFKIWGDKMNYFALVKEE